MKKIFLAVALFTGVAVHADYLYWMVTDNPQAGTDITGAETKFNWDKAVLTWDGAASGTMDLSSSDATLYKTLGTYAIADIGTGYTSFFVELYNGDTWLAKSAVGNASTLAQYITSGMSLNPVAGNAGWVATSYAVPEPTSGLLFLIGGMLLGLKRRRQV